MKILNITYSVIAAVIAIMFIQILVVGRQNAEISAQLNQAQRTVTGGHNDLAALQALASRVTEAAATDDQLKTVLDRLNLHLSSSAATKPTH